MRVQPLAVRERYPAKELGHLAFFPRPKDHVPVVGPQAVRQQPDGTAMHRLGHNPLEGGVIFRLVKEFISSVAAIEGVVNYSAGGHACGVVA